MFSSNSNKILVTGSAGFIGNLIIPYLKDYGFFIRGYDCKIDTLSDEFVKGQIEDTELLRKSLSGIDSIIHLAAFSDEGDFLKKILKPNIIGIYSLFEAIRGCNIERIILASSIQATDINDHINVTVSVNQGNPTSYYGLSKIWLEKVAQMNTRLYNLNTIAVRLGWIIKSRREFEEIQNDPRLKSCFFSHLDTQNFFLSCLTVPFKGFSIINAVSRSSSSRSYDMEKTKQTIKFQPEYEFPNGLISHIITQ